MPCSRCFNSTPACSCFPATVKAANSLHGSLLPSSGDDPKMLPRGSPQTTPKDILPLQPHLAASPNSAGRRNVTHSGSAPKPSAHLRDSMPVPRTRSQTTPIRIPGSFDDSGNSRRMPRAALSRDKIIARVNELVRSPTRREEARRFSRKRQGESPEHPRASNRAGRTETSPFRERPPTTAPPSRSLLGADLQRTTRATTPDERMGFWLEWQFTIGPRSGSQFSRNRKQFQDSVARAHNATVSTLHPRIEEVNRVQGPSWSLQMQLGRPLNPDTLVNAELISPHFNMSDDWKSHIEATWNFLSSQFRTGISNHPQVTVFVSPNPTLTIAECIKICQAAIHFDPALTSFIPSPCRRNWHDNGCLGPPHNTRSHAIIMLDDLLNVQCSDDEKITILTSLFQPAAPPSNPSSPPFLPSSETPSLSSSASPPFPDPFGLDYLFTLLSAAEANDLQMSIPANIFTTPGWGTTWPSFAVDFVRAALRCECSVLLAGWTPDAAGLRKFLAGGKGGGVVVGPSERGTLQTVEVGTGRVLVGNEGGRGRWGVDRDSEL